MKKFFYSIFLLFFSLFVGLYSVSANCTTADNEWASGFVQFLEDCSNAWATGANPGIQLEDSPDTKAIQQKIISIAEKTFGFAALFAILAIVVSGIIMTVSYDDDSRLTIAKKTAMFATIGLFISLISFSVVRTLVEFIYKLAGN